MTNASIATIAAGAIFQPGTSDAEIEAKAAKAARQRKSAVYFWRYFILVFFLGGWELAVKFKLLDPFFFSSPSAIVMRLVEWVVDGTSEGPLWYHLWVTMEESLLGFFSGSVAGIVAGIALGRNRMLADVFSIYIKVINSVPRVVLAPIFIMIFGLGLTSKVALSFVMVFFVVFSNAFQGVVEADRNLLANAQILGARGWQLTRSVVIPSAMSWIFASLHVSFGFAIVGAIVGEFVGARYGIGLLINVAKGSFDAAGMYAAIVIIMVVALAAEYAMTQVENRLAKWRPAPLQELH
ncbi:binding-protein-dependent transport systems inner membrane component [Rhodoferax ferrireducens T118]|uniref:Binding-protein-dependent transport systems inner membrane component n=1 Tax=Albidiferax ferrireducens (strain ATCC BAA-621 / DSM 15236 / T118) TaxID=338969 RepID=Q21TT0_ALBFT|nr:ABC transporter permease [Rhodoferax ferrireducens]ABD70823.1 binding-protein-dependent transport systems inner membrane component [Rhodoferax ferrireducens T118]WPC65911.1 ABC transporter permease [Rhodoferax ferrireducens]